MATDKVLLAQTSVDQASSGSRQRGAEVSASGPASGEAASSGSVLLLQGEPDGAEEGELSAIRRFSEGSPLATLPMQLDVTIPVPQFRVHSLLALENGAVLESGWVHTEDVPVWCGGEQLVWAEFEVIDQKLAVRVTRVG